MPKVLYFVVCVADAGRVDEAESHAIDVHAVFYHVAGGAMHIGHDGAFLVEQYVEQG